MDVGDVARHSFGIVRRGFDPQEVRAYLELLTKTLEHADRREQELLQGLEEAEERARHPVIDESVLTSALGQRSAAVLRGAHEEAARILSQAEEAAAAMVRDAQQQATDVQVNAESSAAERIAEAELEANALRQQSRDEAAATLGAANEEGEVLVERAREHGRSMLDQAQEARRRVLADMAHRRRLVTEQIDLLRSARDEIAGSVVGVRRSLDRIMEDLSRAEDSARAVAAGAARPHSVDVPEPVLVEEGERAVAELGELDGEGTQPQDDAPTRAPRAVLRFDDVATPVGQQASRSSQSSDDDGPAASGSDDERTSVPAVVVRPAEGSAADTGTRGAEARAGLVHDWQDDPALAATGAHADLGPEELVPEGAESADPAAGGTDVDGLFARLRARQHTGRDDAGGPPEAEDATTPLEAEPAAEEVEPAPEEAEASPDTLAFARRTDALDPIVTNLARRLKRALQDDQNRLLDRLRQGTGEWSDGLLVDEASQKSLYSDAATTSVRDAMSAGNAFARAAVGGRRAKAAAPDQRAVDAVSGELASTVVTLIRRRLESGEIPDAAERVGAAYREWRGERIERLAEDSAVEAFSKGVLAGVGKGAVRWSRNEVGPGCADCEDNALAGAVVPGDEFPTGHRHPPAHAGCRCLVLPTPI